jgi:hypothetical protein
VLGATAQLVFATVILAPLSYIAASANLPLQDANLHAIDQALGRTSGRHRAAGQRRAHTIVTLTSVAPAASHAAPFSAGLSG